MAPGTQFSNGNDGWYISLEAGPNNTAPLSCYTLVTYFQQDQQRGVYLIRIPDLDPAEGISKVVIQAGPASSARTSERILSLQELLLAGRLQKLVYQDVTRTLDATTATSAELSRPAGNSIREHLVLLYQEKNLADAQYALLPNKQLPDAIRNLPTLQYQNACGADLAIHFSQLTNRYPQLFRTGSTLAQPGGFSALQIRQNTATVQIAWQTMREDRIRGYEIERRSAGNDWASVGFIDSKTAQEGPTGNLSYLYGDASPGNGTVMYRVKQIGEDGQVRYSEEQSWNVQWEQKPMVIYPNPSPDGRARIAFSRTEGRKDVFVLDVNGQAVKQWTVMNNPAQEIRDLQPGTYIIKVADRLTGAVYTDRLIVRRP